jgi:hypothetical protein
MAYGGGIGLFGTDTAKLTLAWLQIFESDADRGMLNQCVDGPMHLVHPGVPTYRVLLGATASIAGTENSLRIC